MQMKLKLVLITIFIAILTNGCKAKVEEAVIIDNGNPTISQPETPPVIEEVEPEKPKKEGVPSPLSGIYVAEEKVNRRPVAIMFDNHNGARWQAGLKDAEIVYEFLVEAPYTRYMGIYLVNEPELVGPIRSSRPYFVTTLLEYDAVYVRVGGSVQAMNDIKDLKVADIDGLSSSNKVFWRKTHKKTPHNLYSSMEAIRTTQAERKYRLEGEYTAFKFHEDELDMEGLEAKYIKINYRKSNTTEYNYDVENKYYTRNKDGELHVDEIDQSPIIAKNIIIQEAKTKVIDNEGRLEIELIGSGKGKYITNGKYIDITWKKDSRSEKTLYYNSNGEEIVLNPGVTWIQVVEPTTNINIE